MFRCNLPPALLANDRGLLRATLVTRVWNGYRTRVSIEIALEENILPLLLPGFELATF